MAVTCGPRAAKELIEFRAAMDQLPQARALTLCPTTVSHTTHEVPRGFSARLGLVNAHSQAIRRVTLVADCDGIIPDVVDVSGIGRSYAIRHLPCDECD